MTKNVDAIRQLFGGRNNAGNVPSLPVIWPLMCFAGIWTSWTSVRKAKEGEITADVFGFLNSAPNAEVAKVHPQAMPVILTTKTNAISG